ncbi:bifunctional diaminohydroxyphosphoribosylaminopyrimidine deaminase/5-amino-6-(5-phosphoribosylamino)uracil reductase RibD [Frigoribacterium sp. CFBP 13712]|uniref:bifunctional diaminohydroxyphosphoribosylaminopyrimidine deaminase/5-amino-6-(5-phosphoribosylamino)uracil reductase RibD n=1 Tax=Frigoribacterium sp. CFBP 13712 TaxID=2775309 RepID=UPI00177EB7BD|nr:bifunctional diaminohydroxyphosphoribosylaminopyrimidine deaminase/5-amino-6-(5-phosphoribosylamino)uracil reductase RibD [Frigoribacterium sp. CFBP 13712]MBD8702526.1 bifunctional diaminohydroxyphosphoribosylaminopyrimidine deaminase/5-amino-6-(5-phosphoribosylamino)uracil reductase RibD [Frigoribacterium sp. CFBP 13712]
MTTPSSAYDAAMRRALELALRGTSLGPNPQVGCVLLRPDLTVAAEGWHRGAGTPHAEVDALSRLAPGESAVGLTAVVSLEPCDHTGRTGPCSEALIGAGVSRVVYAVSDPGESSSGGAERLRRAGVEVVAGVLRDDAEETIRPWLVATRAGRPFVTLKWASSLDGRAAAADGTSRWITGTAARQHVHEQRAAHDAILVGTGTVLADDPGLTARGDGGELLADQPLPVVVGHRPVPADAELRRHPRALVETGSRDLEAVLADLYGRGVRSVFVEGGPTVASEFVRRGLVDDYLVYLAPTLLGGPRTALGDLGVASIDGQVRLVTTRVTPLGDDVLIVARAQPRRTP